MDDSADERGERAEDSALLEEFLLLRDAGRGQDARNLIAGASEDRHDLRERAQLIASLDELSVLLAEDPSEVPADLEELGRFEELELIGEGGLSRVFLANDPRLGRRVALKVLSPGALNSRDARDWMLSEGRSLAHLKHESVVRVFEVDEAGGFAYIAMEHVEGASLFETLEALRVRLGEHDARQNDDDAPPSEAAMRAAERLEPMAARLRLVSQLAHALDYCHEQGIVHRDIKPANVLLATDGTPKLIDFGLAHFESEDESLGLTERLVGTAAYLSPEQVDQERTGASALSDQFSLGILLYELLTLRHPFVRDTRAATLTAVSAADVSPPSRIDKSIQTDAERVCLHCLERAPEDRYPTITALANDLDAILDLRAVSLQAPSPLRLLQLWVARNRRQVLTGVAVAVALLAMLSTLWVRVQRSTRHELLARLENDQRRVGEMSTAEELSELFRRIIEYAPQSLLLDRALLTGSVYPTTYAELDELRESASRQLFRVVEPDYTRAAQEPYLEDQQRKFELAHRKWSYALGKEDLANPDSTVNDGLRKFGQIVLPERGELFAFTGGQSGVPLYVPRRGSRDLIPGGQYRWIDVTDEGLILETEFFLAPWEPERILPIGSPEPQVSAGLLAWRPGSRPETFETDTLHFDFDQPGFEISSHLVTWGRLVDLIGRADTEDAFRSRDLSGGRPASMVGDLDDELDAPATVDWRLALRAATRLGCRLPTLPELLVAHRDLKLSDADGLEWSAGAADNNSVTRTAFNAVAFLNSEEVEWSDRFRGAIDSPPIGVSKRSIRFRVARSLEARVGFVTR